MRALFFAALFAVFLPMTAASATDDDPFLWLENIDGDRALHWVRDHNARTLPELEAVPGFAGWQTRAQAILEDPRRIAWPDGAQPSGVLDGRVFNFWRDASHVRGLWRTSPRAAFDAGQPQWQTLVDIDALEAETGGNIQFAGAQCLPGASHCLIGLSEGGKDARTLREFDLATARFVPVDAGGFVTSAAKQNVAWIDHDRLLVATAAGPVTTSGYAREARLWQRGSIFADARLLLSIAPDAMGVFPAAFGQGAGRRAVLVEATSFWTARVHHLLADGTLALAPLPADADFRFIADLGDGPRAFALLRSALNAIPEGSLVSYAVGADGRFGAVEAAFTPGPTQAIAGVEATGKAVYLSLLDDVAARLLRLTRTATGWASRDIAIPANSSLSLVAADDADTLADTLYVNVVGFTEPARLLRIADGAAPVTLATAPAFFDGTKYSVSQRFAVSADGTNIPYFLVRPKDATGPLNTYLWAYGGFEIPLVPTYLQPDQMLWMEAGNQFVVANIRGGGEYGPRWHKAALREKRQTSYDDLHAVATALKAEGLASGLAVHGRSNGGLMAAVAYTERPDLYDAALVGVPLADMKRYHLLLAGASWMDEYGNPDTSDWDFIRGYSPYQAIRPDIKYPRVFFYTSTKDDRVHPGHARKMAARMEAMGHPVYYYENIDGGHAGVANLREAAYRYALIRAYLAKELP